MRFSRVLALRKMEIKPPALHYPTYCAELAQLMPCRHEDPRPRLKGTKPSGSPYYRYQCPACGAPLDPTQLKHSIIEEYRIKGGVIEDWDQAAVVAYFDTRARHADGIRRKYGWNQEEWWSRYEKYLASEEWRILRQKVLVRDNYTCRGCNVALATQVHHTTYERVGQEDLADLLSVCAPCHRGIHDISLNDAAGF